MQNRTSNNRKPKESIQDSLNQTGNPLPDDKQNQNHNTKKVALGPNTKR